ncbi:hypothetical protein HDU97_001920 [Phlyctochytrium planicorne]|nr:hypothetical protein HDU97_001920 [Phlyctochytrium planicorne]
MASKEVEIVTPPSTNANTVVADSGPNSKAPSSDKAAVVPSHNDPSTPFGFTADELSELINPTRDPYRLLMHGGVSGILKGLHVNPDVGLVTVAQDEREEQEQGIPAEKGKKNAPYHVGNTTSTSAAHLEASTVDGIESGQIPRKLRREVFGENVLPSVKPKSIFQFMLQAMEDKILILLTVVAFVSLAIGLYQDFKPKPDDAPPEDKHFQKEGQFRRLNAKKEDRKVKAIRDGKTQLISIYGILVGDILLLEPGDVIAADGVYISGMGLKVDESAATGETDAIKKGEDHDPFIVSGGKVNEGIGKYVVTGVGVHSFFGKTMMALRTESEDTPLQVKLDGLAERIAKLGAAIAILMFVVLLLKYIIVVLQGSGFGDSRPEQESGTEIVTRLVNILIQSITIVVVAVPEGLPLAVTLALAYATTRMLKDNNLVRVLSACETMGNATTICSDKTGTLTQNKMTVVTGVIGKNVLFEGEEEVKALRDRLGTLSSSPAAEVDLPIAPSPGVKQPGPDAVTLFDRIMENVAINSSAFEGKDDNGNAVIIGSKTETALLEWSIRSGFDYKSMRTSKTVETVQIYPFSSERKRMATIVKTTGRDGKPVYRVHVKGASEIVLRDCDRVALLPFSTSPTAVAHEAKEGTNSGRPLSAIPALGSRSNPTSPVIYPLDQKLVSDYGDIINRFAEQSLRTIALAYREFTEDEFFAILRGPVRDKLMEQRKAEREEQKKTKTADDGLLVDVPSPLPSKDVPITPTTEHRPSHLSVGDATGPGSETRSFDTRNEDDEEPNDAELLGSNFALDEMGGKGLIAACIVGIEDPLRNGVAEAVADCQRAGVFVRMVTGDNVLTARAIATKCGIHTKGGLVMEGSYFRKLTDAERFAILPRLQVLARSSPTDKQLLVSNLKTMGETVAVTGDGTNDGPALKMADIGFSMGIAGTEVAKEASSIILMDDSFSSVVKAIVWGRGVNDSVKKFLQFQLSVNISAVLITFISAIVDSGESSVLTAVQLLWVNLIMDTLAALALATEIPTRENLQRPPESRKAPLISVTMWKMVIGQAVLQIAVNLAMLFAGPSLFRFNELQAAGGVLRAPDDHGIVQDQKLQLRTIVFNSFVMMQMFNQINCRRIDNNVNIFSGIHRNPYLYTIFFSVILVQALIVQFAGVAFSTTPITGAQWGVCVLVGFLSIPWGVIVRLIPDDLFTSCFNKRERPSAQTVDAAGNVEMLPILGPDAANAVNAAANAAAAAATGRAPQQQPNPNPTAAPSPVGSHSGGLAPIQTANVPGISVTVPINDPVTARAQWASAIENVQTKLEVFKALRGGSRRGEAPRASVASSSSIPQAPPLRASHTAVNMQKVRKNSRAQTMDGVSSAAVAGIGLGLAGTGVPGDGSKKSQTGFASL